MEIKAKINKWDLINLKSFCTMKETIMKVNRQPSEWEKTIANETTDKELICKVYKQLMHLNTRKMNKWDLVKLKSFCTAKETINKMKRQSTAWGKIFANDATSKGLISKINE